MTVAEKTGDGDGYVAWLEKRSRTGSRGSHGDGLCREEAEAPGGRSGRRVEEAVLGGDEEAPTETGGAGRRRGIGMRWRCRGAVSPDPDRGERGRRAGWDEWESGMR